MNLAGTGAIAVTFILVVMRALALMVKVYDAFFGLYNLPSLFQP